MIIQGQEQMDNLDISSIRNIREINISNVDYIPEGKFNNLPNLRKLDIYNAKVIEAGAFMNCRNLEVFNSDNNIKEIHDFAFYNTNIGFIPELYKNTKFGIYNNIGKNITLENTSWSNLSKLSNLNKCKKYFNIGDTKSMTLTNGETYNAEIIGFNHDNLADGTGKAGITFQFKELITTKHVINTEQTNVGGWEMSEIRIYVNNDVFTLLPTDLQDKIKEVVKLSDAGNMDTTTLVETTDKLFLLSLEEVRLSSPYNVYNVAGQGKKYKKFTNKSSRVKYLSGSATCWWLRSTSTSIAGFFFYVTTDGSDDYSYGYIPDGIAPAFCI